MEIWSGDDNRIQRIWSLSSIRSQSTDIKLTISPVINLRLASLLSLSDCENIIHRDSWGGEKKKKKKKTIKTLVNPNKVNIYFNSREKMIYPMWPSEHVYAWCVKWALHSRARKKKKKKKKKGRNMTTQTPQFKIKCCLRQWEFARVAYTIFFFLRSCKFFLFKTILNQDARAAMFLFSLFLSLVYYSFWMPGINVLALPNWACHFFDIN